MAAATAIKATRPRAPTDRHFHGLDSRPPLHPTEVNSSQTRGSWTGASTASRHSNILKMPTPAAAGRLHRPMDEVAPRLLPPSRRVDVMPLHPRGTAGEVPQPLAPGRESTIHGQGFG